MFELEENGAHPRDVFHVLGALWVEVTQLGDPEKKDVLSHVLAIGQKKVKNKMSSTISTFPTQFLVPPVEKELLQMSCPQFYAHPCNNQKIYLTKNTNNVLKSKNTNIIFKLLMDLLN